MTTFCESTQTSLWDAIQGNQVSDPIRNLLNSLEVGYWDWNIAEETLATNEFYHSMIGEKPADSILPDHYFTDKLHSEDRDAVLKAVADIQDGSQQSFDVDFRLKCANNSYKWIRSIATVAERDSQGNALRLIGQHIDIDQQKRREIAQQALNSLNAKGSQQEVLTQFCKAVSSIFDSSYVAITHLTNKDGVDWAQVSGGWKNGEPVVDLEYPVKGTPCSKTANRGHWITNSDVQESFPEAIYLEELDAVSYAGIRLHGRLGLPVALLSLASNTPLNDSLDVLGVLKLIGSRAEMELQRFELDKELRKARKIAERADRSKSDFLANMSHEIRNPLTTILGYTELLGSDSEFSADVLRSVDAIESIKKSGHQLLGVINDILDASKIDAGNLIVETVSTDPLQVINAVCKELRPKAIERGIEFSIEYLSEIPQQMASDPHRLQQVLHHLIDNAIKFTEQGSVIVAVSCHESYEFDNMMIFDVIDTGIGLTVEQKKRVETYQPFTQADGSSTRQHGGVGLGLRIANALATMLGGGIEIVSRKGIGSTFSLSVSAGFLGDVKMLDEKDIAKHIEQLNTISCESPNRINEQPLLGKRILVAEDGKDNQNLISYHLNKAGAEVVVAENGIIALEKVAEAQSQSEVFHVLFMDMQMPELDGYSATRALREQDYQLPIIALTANAMDDDRMKCIIAGCDDYISKPIDAKNLIDLCNQFAQASAETRDYSPLKLV